jgi:hypothetical protein
MDGLPWCLSLSYISSPGPDPLLPPFRSSDMLTFVYFALLCAGSLQHLIGAIAAVIPVVAQSQHRTQLSRRLNATGTTGVTLQDDHDLSYKATMSVP